MVKRYDKQNICGIRIYQFPSLSFTFRSDPESEGISSATFVNTYL